VLSYQCVHSALSFLGVHQRMGSCWSCATVGAVADAGSSCADVASVVAAAAVGLLQLCKRIVDAQCVANADTASCIKQEMDALDLAAYPPAQPQPLTTAAKAGIAVAAVAGSATLAAALLFLQHKRRQQAAASAAASLLPVVTKPDNKCVELSSGSGGSSSNGGAHGSYNKPDGLTPHSTRPTSHDSTSSVPSWKGGGVSSMVTISSRTSLSMPSILKGTLTAQQAAALQLGEGVQQQWLVCSSSG
jgi:hypothetical protein